MSIEQLDPLPDFNALLVENPVATFAVRVSGKSMTGAGIFPGDIAIVNKARVPVNGSIVVAIVDNEFTLKRYRVKGGAIYLQAENPAFTDIKITEGMYFEVWGVVTNSIRTL
jgi:DNA polymerase V